MKFVKFAALALVLASTAPSVFADDKAVNTETQDLLAAQADVASAEVAADDAAKTSAK